MSTDGDSCEKRFVPNVFILDCENARKVAAAADAGKSDILLLLYSYEFKLNTSDAQRVKIF